jgi:hypothetical protein
MARRFTEAISAAIVRTRRVPQEPWVSRSERSAEFGGETRHWATRGKPSPSREARMQHRTLRLDLARSREGDLGAPPDQRMNAEANLVRPSSAASFAPAGRDRRRDAVAVAVGLSHQLDAIGVGTPSPSPWAFRTSWTQSASGRRRRRSFAPAGRDRRREGGAHP